MTLATHSGSLECVRMLLAKWSYHNYSQSALMPPLCVAAFRGHLQLVKMFAKMYPSPEHIKTIHGKCSIRQFLFVFNFNYNSKGVNALMLAMTGGHHAVELYLIEFYPALWREKTPFGNTAADLIAHLPTPAAMLARRQ